MGIERYFSKGLGNLYTDTSGKIDYQPREISITDRDGKVVEKIDEAIFPSWWGQDAANTVALKYFRKADVPTEEGREIDIRQLVKRVAGKISEWGLEQGYFEQKEARNLENELAAMTLFQYGAFNSPVWFNLGLDYYGLEKKDEERFTIKDGKVVKVENSYENPQISACFINHPEDSIESMMQTAAVISSRVFKDGSGIGSYWGYVRPAGAQVSGGGVASGANRFMDMQDSSARVIKSGGKTRRAAVWQGLPIWHGDMKSTLKHKYKEEEKGRVLIEAGSSDDWESHTIQDLRAQNVNISIRIDDAFWQAYEKNEDYAIQNIIDGEIIEEGKARDLAEMLAFAAHNCGDPGIQNHTVINEWNTCINSEEIVGSNPCSEYMFVNNSACNLASMNLMKFRLEDGVFNVKSFKKAVDRYIKSQEILVSKASYPTEEIAWNSHIYRPLGLGYANLGAYIMSMGWAYDSDEARSFASAVTSLMTAEAYLESTRMAEKLGPFQEFQKNREPMLEVMEKHRKASKQITPINGLEEILETANNVWDEVIERGEKYGFRNAQVTLEPPTGTIAYMMECDTTGIEPDQALKKYKELAGGGTMEIVNKTVPMALEKLDYNEDEITQIIDYIDEHSTIEGNEILREDHLPIFDCSLTAGEGVRTISPMGHIKMLGAIQPFISGGISKTINCPYNTTVEEVEDMFYQGWKHGIKALAIYRYGSKAAQPITTKGAEELENLTRGQREHMPQERNARIVKVKIADIPLFLIAGEYDDGRLGELFIDSFERGSEINRLLNEAGIQFSEKLQYGVALKEAVEVFNKAGLSQLLGPTNYPFIPQVRGMEEFIYQWVSANYEGNISFVSKNNPELRPLPWELRIYKQQPRLHLIPTVAGEKFYPDSPSLEETIEKISGMNYWLDREEGLDTRKTIEKIKRTRKWEGDEALSDKSNWQMTGRVCKCGTILINDGTCWACPRCKTSTGGCGGN